MVTPDIIGWIGNIFYVVGAISIAFKRPIFGQSSNVIGGALYAVQGFLTGMTSLLAIELFLVIINILGVYNWRKK